MLQDSPWAFGADPRNDVALDPAHLRTALAKPENAIIAVESSDDSPLLVAAAGIYRVDNPKFSHRAKLWGVFVESDYRGRGLGNAVTLAAIDLASSWNGVTYIDAGVSESSPSALRLYKRLGFVEWGREPESTQYDGQRFDEIFLSRRVPDDGSA